MAASLRLGEVPVRRPGLRPNLLRPARQFRVLLVPPRFKPHFQLQNVDEMAEIPPVGCPGCGPWDGCAQRLVLRLRCPHVRQVYVRLHSSVAFRQANAETRLQKAVVKLLQNAALIISFN